MTETQSKFEQSMTIHAAPDEIFDFVPNVSNLPKTFHLPNTPQHKALESITTT